MSDVDEWLRDGIAALKAGDRAEAQALLLRVVEADERNEAGWLWLSGAVETDNDRLVCLENVLALNPDNPAARRGLAKLSETRQTAVSPTPASFIGYKQTSAYDDVWEQDNDLCAYCAQVVTDQQPRCPRCGRNLNVSAYRYEQPNTSLHIFWVLLLGTGQLFLLQALYDVIVRRSVVVAVLPSLLMIAFVALAGGVYFRQFWAYVAAVALLCLILFANIAGFLIPAEMAPEALWQIGPIFDEVVNPLFAALATLLQVFQVTAVLLALYYAAFKAGPDFERTTRRQIAAVPSGLREAGSYHAAASRAAERGEWATAVLLWQRAAAKEPTQVTFQRNLAAAYARLGFYRRSEDVLQTALARPLTPEQQTQLARLREAVQRALADDPSQPKENRHE